MKFFLTTLLKLKSKLTVLSSHEKVPAKSWRIVRTNLRSKAVFVRELQGLQHSDQLQKLVENDCEMSSTENWRIQLIWNTISRFQN